MLRRLFEIFLLVRFCCTAVIAAANSELSRQENCGVTLFPSEETNTNKVRLLQEYPWIATLKYKSRSASETESKIRCTGTLISKRYILTSATCTRNDTNIVGATLGSTEKGAPPPQTFNISNEDVTAHPNHTITKNDIALIRLPKDVNDFITPICLPIQDDARNNQFKRNLTVAGWFINPREERSAQLEKVSVPVVPNARCAEKFGELANISQKHICAGDATSPDACKNFGGSPLSDEVILDGVNKTVQYGIISFGVRGCSDKFKEYPRVYTRISAYIDWILDNIKA